MKAKWKIQLVIKGILTVHSGKKSAQNSHFTLKIDHQYNAHMTPKCRKKNESDKLKMSLSIIR